jgi:hypothetical protein
MDVEISEMEKIDADRMDGVGGPATGIPILLMKSLPEPAEKDWAQWDAAHEGGGKGKPSAAGDSKASAADAVARAKQTIADHKAGKKVSAAELKNAHEVHEAHLAHEAKLKADAEAKAKAKGSSAKPAAKPAGKPGAAAAAGTAAASALTSKKEVAKGTRDCPKCEKSYDADHEGSTCENCGTDLPDAPASKAADDREAAKSLVRGIIAKAVGADGEVDEEPDIAGGTDVLARIADLIIAEAQELKAGQAGEIADILELACAAERIWCWRTGEESVASGSVMPATALMQSAADVEKAGPTAEERRQAASEGNALSDGSYPIRNEHELHAAAILARSGHGDVEGAKRLISRRSKELGVKNPLEDDGDASKSAGEGKIAEDGKTMDTVTQETGGLAKAVEDAVAKATGPLEERIKALSEDLAKVKATPIPGGLVLSRNVQVKAPGGIVNEDYAAKAAHYRDMAETVTDRTVADGYRKLAREADAKAVTPTS